MLSLPDFRYKQLLVYNAIESEKNRLKFKLDNIVVEDSDGNIKMQHSMHRIFALFTIGPMSFTNYAVKKAKQFGFPIIMMSQNLHVDAYFNNRADGNFLLRKKQYLYTDEFNLLIAKKLIRQKINNQIKLLKNLRYRSEELNKTILSIEEINPDMACNNSELMGFEGHASKLFFEAYYKPMEWRRREPMCKGYIYNLLLDIGYTYLFNFIDAMLGLYGFDVYCGVLHRFFYQRKSLVCDLIEPFRCIIDQRIRKAYNLRQIHKEDFFEKQGVYSLQYKKTVSYTRLFLKDILERKEDIFLYIQRYYRWVMDPENPNRKFPVFEV